MKYLLVCLGCVSLALGVLGIFLPLLPTTPFLLLSAALFARSSPRLYNFLLNHRVLGSYIRSFLDERAIPLRIKVISITLLWTALLCSAFFFVEKIWMRVILMAVAVGVTLHILSFKTARKASTQKGGNLSMRTFLNSHRKKFLFVGLGILAFAGLLRWLCVPAPYVHFLFGMAIVCKAIFLFATLFLGKKPRMTLPLKLIIAGVVLILLSLPFKNLFPLPLLHKGLFYLAISLKVSALFLLLFKKR
jgi:uncharacterized membrane protein YbaN (DUF454 family)